jgi:AcrR family transcriptional regulator
LSRVSQPDASSDAVSGVRRGSSTRQRIMIEAARLFAEQGYDATSVDTIAQAAGIAAPSIYKHFPTKHAVLLAVTDRATRTSQARRGLGHTDDLPDQLAALFAEYLADGQSQRRRLSIELSRAAMRNAEVAEALAGYNAELRAALAETIGHSRPGLAVAEREMLAHLFLVLLMGGIHLDTLDADLIGDAGLIGYLRDHFGVVLGSDPPPVDAPPRPRRRAAPAVDEPPDPTDGRRARTVRTRRRILDAATELFALHGYDGTSTEMIASRADITVPGLYRHVSSKEQLLVDVGRRAFDRYRLALPDVDDGRGADGLAGAIAAFARDRDSVARRLAVELDFGAWRSEALAAALKEFHREVRTGVAEALLTHQPDISGVDADRAAMVVLMLFMGSAHIDTVDPTLVDNAAWRNCLRRRVPQLVGPVRH